LIEFIGIRKKNKVKIAELFNLISNMNSESIKQFSLVNKISLNVKDPEYNNLIHKVLLDDNKKSEYQRLNMIKFLVNENINPDEPMKIISLLYILLLVNSILK
jgi:hypothetical protein